MHPSGVFNWLRTAGVCRPLGESRKLAASKGKGRAFGQEVYDQVRMLYAGGFSGSSIDRRLGLTRGAALEIVMRHGESRSVSESVSLAYETGVLINGRRHAVDAEVFSRELTPASAWALGVIFGDGCLVRHKGVLHSLEVAGEEDVCCKVACVLGTDAPVRKKGGCWILRVGHGDLVDSLLARGVMPNKSRTMQFPELSEDLVSHFVRGFWDADGSVCWCGGCKPTLTASSMSRLFMEKILGVVAGVTGTTWKLRPHSSTGIFSVTVSCVMAKKLAAWLWSGSSPENRSDRKFRLAVQYGLLTERFALTA